MKKEKNFNGTRLKTWLFNKPLVFTFSFIGLSFLFCLFYSLIQMVFNIETIAPMYALCGISFVLSIYYTLRKLPRDKMSQNDFIAITNGAGLISIISSFVVLLTAGIIENTFRFRMMALYMLHTHTTVFFILFVLALLFSLYLIGVAISGIYAKYLRSVTLGISPWKVILSMPFAFLMMWTPGYLLKGKDIKSNMEIKCNWYSKFNKWVMSNFNNILFVFLFLLFCKNAISGLTTLMLSLALLIIYALWYTKHKSDFVKNINNGYALTAVCINIALLLAIIVSAL